MPVAAFPEFPTNVPTHPLVVIDYQLIKNGDEKEMDMLWKAATSLGFWYLKNHGAEEDVENMFDMGAETMNLPMEEKMKYEQGDEGSSFGYKAAGTNATDASGTPDKTEFINVAKDDALAWPKQARRAYPSTVNDRMESTIIPFVKKSIEINDTILSIFNTKLGLPEGTLQKLHPLDEYSGSEARTIKVPKNFPAEKQALGAHTDFGSLSFLHNRLGGLQVLPPGIDEWQYVKPVPGHAICNVGDALTLLSGGILRSNIHRVFPPPGAQASFERWSQVFFTRPENSVVLRSLSEESSMIAEAVSKLTEEAEGSFEPRGHVVRVV
ncbi:Clavaminate synthase-like protein [Gymnopus androsaceus JB14]|uniref:Clavaminate synthase-like protein n=1 Tax=Gymnopus androsaceus JB14 TaxID=1447944 RepID=A0A6A4I7Y6_9AGAR|nr:Clavaminate synthase-like protein [Gymnopus androsaceus JB14]